ncbi:hypothetical protein FNV43_RR24762 [Rhamnella rubrinervis]|uniref:C2H2-type domain-containing protein n=1 Tax=Rhamnella rubrinervis TaxID=2594499 RepID=A0A8K0GPF5_9ROSA|nr:hypothetical protein FNV43_RR24762 [Rhamnella rubrinervis]
MEEAQYWMWMKRKQMLMSHFQAPIINSFRSSSSSWEEKAFAEDAAGGSLGGCIWPPRSYSCSFCMREFRSAQALGGHMNVHRRDRARLKQCLISPHITTSTTDVSHHRRRRRRRQDHDHVNSGSPRLVASSRFLSLNSSVSPSAVAAPCSDLKPDQYLGKKYSKVEEEDCIWLGEEDDDGHVGTDLFVGLNNSVVGRNRQSMFCYEERNYKRTKTAISSPIVPLFHQLQPCHLQSEVINQYKVGITSMDDLDLELRLGDPSKG